MGWEQNVPNKARLVAMTTPALSSGLGKFGINHMSIRAYHSDEIGGFHADVEQCDVMVVLILGNTTMEGCIPKIGKRSTANEAGSVSNAKTY